MDLKLMTCAILSGLTAGCHGQSRRPTAAGVTQAALDDIAVSLKVQVAVVENVPGKPVDGGFAADCPKDAPAGLCLDARISLTNGGAAWNVAGWAIYYSSIRRVLSVNSAELEITHLNGDLHKIEPTDRFTGFARNETKVIPFKAEYWMMSESDVMPRFYIAAVGLVPKVLASTDTEELGALVAPFADARQTRRHPDDQSVIATAATRFAENGAVPDLGAARVAAEIVPTPRSVQLPASPGTLDLSAGVNIGAAALGAALPAVKARLARLGVDVTPASGGVPVSVAIDPANPAFTAAGRTSVEAYVLEVGATGVAIVGGDAAGAFYGLQTLAALVPASFATSQAIPRITVAYDAPRYRYRGLQLDVARNFHSLAEIVKVLDQMAAYKLNALHLHLSDDEGWRLEIPGLVELTGVGGKRCHDLSEKTCLLPQLGSGPDARNAGTGYLSRADFVTLLGEARARHVEVIPEFETPAHARASIKAMDARAAATGDRTYLLSDPADQSRYLTLQNYHDDAVNACLDSSYAFIGKVMDEVKLMYAEAGTALTTWHLGGDEVAAGAWSDSPACQALFASSAEVKSVDDVHGYFVRRVNQLAQQRGFGIRGWSDGVRKSVRGAAGPTKVVLDRHTDLGDNTVSVNWWAPLFWWDNLAQGFANAGYQVVLSSPDFLYFDHPYEADPRERGYYWATRYTSTRKLFGYMPGNLPANSQITRDRMGGDYTATFKTTTDLGAVHDPVDPLILPANIIGLEGSQWGETIRTDDQLEYMVFPRLLALAERAWHRADWEAPDGTDWQAAVDTTGLSADWQRFASTLGHKELPKLDQQGIKYRIEVPGGIIAAGQLQANIALPGLTIEYQDPAGDWLPYLPANPPALTGTEIRARSSDGRIGRSVVVPR